MIGIYQQLKAFLEVLKLFIEVFFGRNIKHFHQ